MTAGRRLYEGPEWNFDLLRSAHDAIVEIGEGELGLDLYRTQLEVITAEQMIDAYSSFGLPLIYRHWSFGKQFALHEAAYRKGLRGLALEIVINSNPSICYIMEENSMTAQATVLAHAAIGHNHFFKNNAVFRQRTDASTILQYLAFAKRFVAECEERYGEAAVDRVLDAAHALRDQGVDRYGRRSRPSVEEEHRRVVERQRAEQRSFDDLWRTVPAGPEVKDESEAGAAARELGLPEENLLYFIEKHSPALTEWERELVRVIRVVASYFEPQSQTKVMNEGCACWCHYVIMRRLHDLGQIGDGDYLEFLHLHSNVVFQPVFEDPRYGGVNPYALGFAMMCDIERICTEPTAEDREWFPAIAGNGQPVATLRRAWAEFRDESFVTQYLSPRLMREMRLFKLVDDDEEPTLVVDAIHDERGYARVRRALAATFDPSITKPEVEVIDAKFRGDRRLVLQHVVRDRRILDALEVRRVLRHAQALWGYPVVLREVDHKSGITLAEHEQ